jgi:hypothetical protein
VLLLAWEKVDARLCLYTTVRLYTNFKGQGRAKQKASKKFGESVDKETMRLKFETMCDRPLEAPARINDSHSRHTDIHLKLSSSLPLFI